MLITENLVLKFVIANYQVLLSSSTSKCDGISYLLDSYFIGLFIKILEAKMEMILQSCLRCGGSMVCCWSQDWIRFVDVISFIEFWFGAFYM